MKNWLRVNRQNCCSICHHDSWCLVNETAALCMRVASGKQIELADKSVGWIHELKEPAVRMPVRRAPEPEPMVNFEKLFGEWQDHAFQDANERLAAKLGVTTNALTRLQCVWNPIQRAYAFPMRDWNGHICGIRLRNMNGDKWAVKGSHQGAFVPCGTPDKTAWIVEGPTDCAAALSIGCFAIGRPSCSGGIHQILGNLKRLGINRCVIVADNDSKNEFKHGRNTGIDGARTLSEHLPMPHCVVVLPSKDMRAFVNAGGTKPLLESIVKNFVWKIVEQKERHTEKADRCGGQ